MRAKLVPLLSCIVLIAGPSPVYSQSDLKRMIAVPTPLATDRITDFKTSLPADIANRSSMELLPTGAAAGLLIGAKIVSPAKSLDVFIAPSERVTALANAVADTVTREDAGNRSILSDVQKSFQNQRAPSLTMLTKAGTPIDFGTISFVRDVAQATASVQAAGPVALANTAARAVGTLNVNETIAAQLLQAEAAGQIDLSTFRFLPSKDRVGKSLGQAALQPLAQAYNSVSDAYVELLKTPRSAAAQRKLTRVAEEYRSAYIATFDITESDLDARRAAANVHNALARQAQLKAIYNIDTNFPPLSYRQIYDFSRRIVRIRASGQTICSGLALSTHWVVTAGHCMSGRSATDLQVVFEMDDVGVSARAITVVDTWPSPAPGANDQDSIDYVFLRVAEHTDVRGLFDFLEPTTSVADSPETLCVRSQSLGFKEPVFAIGYPRGDRKTVHDYSHVWFPFRVTDEEFKWMRAETYARAKLVGDQFGDTTYGDRVVKDLENAYRKASNAADPRRSYFAGAAGTVLRPVFGIDTDTFHGNSGSPVFDRRNRCLVGIFAGGARDELRVPEASWKQHEFATPISEIMTHLRSVPAQVGASSDIQKFRDGLLTLLSNQLDVRAH